MEENSLADLNNTLLETLKISGDYPSLKAFFYIRLGENNARYPPSINK